MKRHAPVILCRSTFPSIIGGEVALAEVWREELVNKKKPDKCPVECRKERGKLGKAQSLRGELFQESHLPTSGGQQWASSSPGVGFASEPTAKTPKTLNGRT